MKAKLMMLALSFAFVGFINSQVGPAVDDEALQFIGLLAVGAHQTWIDPLWHPGPGIQAILLGLQAALGFIMVAYFLRHRQDKRRDLDWD